MLTVKWVIKHELGTIIRIFEARNVELAYRNESPRPQADKLRPDWEVSGRRIDKALCILDPTESNFVGRSLDSGTVYVMNETGATVAKHVLSDEVVYYGSLGQTGDDKPPFV